MSRSSRTHNRHHLYYPRRAYTTSPERAFRNLSCNIVWMEIRAHHELHATQRAPRKPAGHYIRRILQEHERHICQICFPREEANRALDELHELQTDVPTTTG